MFSSTTPSAELPNWHPVHCANALLRSALLNAAAPSALPSPELPRTSLGTPWGAITAVSDGSGGITYPGSLAERLNMLTMREEAIAASRRQMSAAPTMLPIEVDEHPHDLAGRAWVESGDMEAFAAGRPLDPAFPVVAPQAHVQALVREFYRRQRRASLLVAGSLAAAVLLTFGGIVLVGSLMAPAAANGDNRPLSRSTSIAWQRPLGFDASPRFEYAVTANRAAKGEPLLIPAVAHIGAPSLAEASPNVQIILATSGRPLALGPLLPPSRAHYLFIRGLPIEAALSAGRRSSSGAWFVKDEELHDLALLVGNAAAGDYPIEVYTLESGDAPQARRSLVLRVETGQQPHSGPKTYEVGPAMSWASALLDYVVPIPPATAEPTVPAESAVLLKRARALIVEGDIASARLLLLHLAERGEGEAAYELARTFDQDALEALGARGMDGDQASAHRWYERASQQGNAKATQRLKILASLSESGPAD